MSESLPEFVAKVVVPGIPKPLTYSIPTKFSSIELGCEVEVPLGTRSVSGWIIEKTSLDSAIDEMNLQAAPSSDQLQLFENGTKKTPFKDILKYSESFLPEQLKLFRWMADYYGASLFDVINNALPKRTRLPLTKTICLSELALEQAKDGDWLASIAARAPTQAKLLSHLFEFGGSIKTRDLGPIIGKNRGVLGALEKKGLILREDVIPTLEERRNTNTTHENIFSYEKPEYLNQDQQAAVTSVCGAIDRNSFQAFLLFGVTGSGKTEVYLQAIEHVLARGGSALVVIPEISLSPQYIDRFSSRLACSLAVLHSQVGSSARWAAWEALRTGQVKVALGARSAIFAPMPNLQLIVVDEEHESSYKQSDSLRYNARDVAVMRAKYSQCSVILGSATPSFESLVNAQNKRYQVLKLPERASPRPLPTIEVVDMSVLKKSEKPSENISPQLHAALGETLKSKKQAVILYNRRGFASYLQCETCQDVLECPSCSVPMTYHKKKDRLLCHWCAYFAAPPSHCPKCRNPKTTRFEVDEPDKKQQREAETIGKLTHRGSGTERVVDEMKELFPDARVLRMDRDTVGHKDAYREILSEIRRGDADILVGTQMIAKGHDLPGVTLVGIIDADIGLHVPDFRSSERAYQLLTQAGGRAGRGEDAGRVFIQTREPKHPTIVAAVTGRFKAFARYEIEFRRKLGYPPIGRLLRLIVSSNSKDEAIEASRVVRKAMDVFDEVKVLGPAPCAYERIRGRYRMHLLIKADSPKVISQIANSMRLWKHGVKGFKDFRLAIDVDPIDML